MSDDPQPAVKKSKPKPWVGLGGKLGPWLKHYLDDTNPKTFLNKSGSAKEAGYQCQGNQSFANVGSQNYIKVQRLVESWMDDHGLTKTNNKKKLLQLSEAIETKIVKIQGKVDKDSLPDNCRLLFVTEQEKFSKDGAKLTEYHSSVAIDLVANETQRRTLDMMIKVLGQYANEKIDINAGDDLIKLMQQGRKRAKEAEDE